MNIAFICTESEENISKGYCDMKILYISTVFPKEGTSTIYTDLAEALAEKGHEVTVVTTEERKNNVDTFMGQERGCNVLRVKTGNMYDVSLVEKGLSMLVIAKILIEAIKKYLANIKVDLILFEAPPVMMEEIVRYAKKQFDAKAFLMMKDIFPQNAVDIKIMKKNGVIYRYFKYKEKKMYLIADRIGCMSEENLNYLKNIEGVNENKLSIFPNTKRINDVKVDSKEIRKKYNIPEDKVVFVFGGNMGKPQGMQFLTDAIIKAMVVEKAFFVLVGRGTEREKVQENLKKYKNNLVLGNLPRNEYEQLVSSCDIGIISLDFRFTIPNYPSRVLSYMEYAMPVLAATDSCTDFRKLIEKEAVCGIWCASNNKNDFVCAVQKLVNDEKMRIELGQNGRNYLEKNFSVEKSVDILEQYYRGN